MQQKLAPVTKLIGAATSDSRNSRRATGASRRIAPLPDKVRRDADGSVRWAVNCEFLAPPKISDEELALAKKSFFDTDWDQSGTIDSSELGRTLRAIGVNPSETEVAEMVKEADVSKGGADGKIDLREFLQWYCKCRKQAAKKAREAVNEEVMEVYHCLGGSNEQGVDKQKVQEMLLEEFDLDVNLEEIFPSPQPEYNRHEFKRLLTPEASKGRMSFGL